MTTNASDNARFTPGTVLPFTGGHPLTLAAFVAVADAARTGASRCGNVYVPMDARAVGLVLADLPMAALPLFASYYGSGAPVGAVGVYGPDGRVAPIGLPGLATPAVIAAALRDNAAAVMDAVEDAVRTLAAAPHAGGTRYTLRVVDGRGNAVEPEGVAPDAFLGAYTIDVSPVPQTCAVGMACGLLTRLPDEALTEAAREALRTLRAVDGTAIPTLDGDARALAVRYGLGDGATDAHLAHLARFKVVGPYTSGTLRGDCAALRELHSRCDAAAGRIKDDAEARAKAVREATEAARATRLAEMREALRAFALTIPELAPGAEDGYDMGPGVADLIAARVEGAADGINGIAETRVLRQGGPGWEDTNPPEARANPRGATVRARRELAEAVTTILSALPPGIELRVSPVGRVLDVVRSEEARDDVYRTGITVLLTGDCPGVPQRMVVCFCE